MRFYPSRTIALPVTSDGNCIKDRDGVVIARIEGNNTFMAHAMADLMNLGAPIAEQKIADDEERENAFRLNWITNQKLTRE